MVFINIAHSCILDRSFY